MKFASKTAAAAATIAMLALGGAGAAQAEERAQPQMTGLIMVEEHGCQNVGGGTWCYGSGIDADTGLKACYSNYHHPSNRHSATAILQNAVDTAVADAGQWAYAYVTNNYAGSCHAKWNDEA
jgi:lactococcin 972 family bacteriocin